MRGGFQQVVVEGHLDGAVAIKLLAHLGVPAPAPVDMRGRPHFWAKAPKYNEAARRGILVMGLVDLEQDPCAPGLIARKLPEGLHRGFVLRVAHRMVESWLLGDQAAMASFLRVSKDRITTNPESLDHPKKEIVRLARYSTKPAIREALVPEQGLSGPVGKEYTPMMKSFVEEHWDPSRARANSPSLERAMRAIQHGEAR